MSINRVEYKREAPGLRYDPEKKVWIGYRIDVIVGGRRDRTGGFGTKKKAQDYIEALKDKQKFKKAGLKIYIEPPRVSALFEERLKHIKAHSERVRGERVFPYFLAKLEYDLRVPDVRPSYFQLFINSRLQDGVKATTVNREINVLSAAFTKASKMFPRELEDYEPPSIPRAEVPKKPKKPRTVTEAEKDAICAFLYAPRGEESEKAYQNRVRIGRMVECAWLIGLRFSEVAKLKKTDYSAGEKSLRVMRANKGGYEGNITMFEFLPEVISNLIEGAIADSETDYIFTHSGNYPKNFYEIFKGAVERAGFAYGRDKWDGITFHRLRHSFITRLVQVTDIATAASFSGHSDGAMVAHYSHASEESRREAMKKLYGDKTDVAKIREFYDKVIAGEVGFEDFVKIIKERKI